MAGSDFGEDIIKSLLKGCLVIMLILAAAGYGIYLLIVHFI